jgi:uncharacterized Zn-binding protein involved in type VI secretion
MSAKIVAVLGDGSTHGGTIVSTNQDGRATLANIAIAVYGANHSCPIIGHGTTTIEENCSTVTTINGKAVVIYGSVAGCGAIIEPPNRNFSTV